MVGNGHTFEQLTYRTSVSCQNTPISRHYTPNLDE